VGPAEASPGAAHDLLLNLAGTLVDDPVLTHDETGRPHIPGLAVSLSRTPNRIAVAATYDGPLGIDLEDLEPRDFTALANRWFTPQELTWLNDQPDRLSAFLHLWTAKESTTKALAQPLHQAALSRPVPLPQPPTPTTLPATRIPNHNTLAVLHLPLTGAVLALTAPTQTTEVIFQDRHFPVHPAT
jgi:phosphopantetheinyl transferase (holo-ACP synthase)